MPAKRWFQRTWLSVILVVTGLGLLLLSWLVQTSENWWAGVLVEAGVTVMLFVPLLLVTGLVERQFRGVRQAQAEIEASQAQTTERIVQLAADVAATQEQVRRTREELADTMRERLSKRAAAEQATVEALESNPSMHSTREALRQASELAIVHPWGIGVPVGRDRLLRFLPVPTPDPMAGWGVDHEYYPDSVLVCRLGWNNASDDELLWSEDQTVEEFLETLALKLRAIDYYPGDEAFAKQAPLIALKEILSRALEANRQGGGTNLRKIALYMPGGWVVTDDGLLNVSDPQRSLRMMYRIKRILDTPYKERGEAIEKEFPEVDQRIAWSLISLISSMAHHGVLDLEKPPF